MKLVKLLSFFIVGSLLLIQQKIVLALTQTEIEYIAKNITVKVNRKDSPKDLMRVGSGAIVCFNSVEKEYYILTNYHVAGPGNKYLIETFDGSQYTINYNDILKLSNVDLVLLKFQSQTVYSIPDFADSDLLTIGKILYIYGWPNLSSVPKLVSGQFSVHKLQENGYDLLYANAKTQRGMSGGPILDENGRLVGIHGQADAFYQRGISINTFLNQLLITQKKYPRINYLQFCNKRDTKLAFDFNTLQSVSDSTEAITSKFGSAIKAILNKI